MQVIANILSTKPVSGSRYFRSYVEVSLPDLRLANFLPTSSNPSINCVVAKMVKRSNPRSSWKRYDQLPRKPLHIQICLLRWEIFKGKFSLLWDAIDILSLLSQYRQRNSSFEGIWEFYNVKKIIKYFVYYHSKVCGYFSSYKIRDTKV